MTIIAEFGRYFQSTPPPTPDYIEFYGIFINSV